MTLPFFIFKYGPCFLITRNKEYLALLLTVVLALGCTSAMADDVFDPMPSNLIGLIKSEGMAGTPSITNGSLSYTINDTDWAAAMAQSGSSNQTAEVIWHYKAPEALRTTGGFYILGEGDTDAAAMADIKAKEASGNHGRFNMVDGNGVPLHPTNMPLTESGETVGFYHADLGVMEPRSFTHKRYVAWYDASKNNVGYYKLNVAVGHTQTSSFPVAGPGKLEVTTPNTTGVALVQQPEVEAGHVTYVLDADTPNLSSVNITTEFKAPVGAAKYVSGKLKGTPVENAVPANGLMTFTNNIPFGQHHAWTTSYLFYKSNGDFLGAYYLTVNMKTDAMDAWPVYDANFLPVAEDRLVITNPAAAAGYKVEKSASYSTNGHVLSAYNGTASGSGDPLQHVKFSVTPPQGAQSYRVWIYGGNAGILGPGTSDKNAMDRIMSSQQLYSVGTVSAHDYAAFSKVTPADKTVDIYVPTAYAVDNLATLCVIYWYSDAAGTQFVYDANTELYGREYFWETIDPTPNYVINPTVDDENDAPANGHPYVVGLERGWSLKVTLYYQVGTNAKHYELTLVNPGGQEVKTYTADAEVTVVIPYPHDKNFTFDLHHYTEALYNEGASTADRTGTDVPLEKKDKGLKFKTDHFSPFVISWASAVVVPDPGDPDTNAAPTTPEVPQTGDSTPIALLLSMMLLSLIAISTIVRRRRKAN